MNRRRWSSAIATLAAVVLATGYWWYSRGDPPVSHDESPSADTESSQGVVASVEVAPVSNGIVAQEITVYGTIVPAAGAVQTVSVPFESRVRRILVTEAQQVSQGDALMEIEPSPDAKLQAEQAQNDYETAKTALGYMQQRFDLKLATNDQLLQARQVLEQAQAKLESLRRRGVDGLRTVRAVVAGLVSKVSVQEGAIVPAGNAVAEMVAQNRLEVRLGVEPENIDKVKLGQNVALTRVNIPESEGVTGQVRKISRAANATTRLVDVFVALPVSSRFLLGEYTRGKIVIASKKGLVVPRSAVLPDEDHYVLFTVKGGRAQKHSIRVGLQDEKNVEVVANDLRPGDLVVTLGNYELQQGMAVKPEKSR
ncbi:MAG: efflux RND transporter periplasmic adaptor subunit [Alphaproteobacteria bacterium]